MPKKYFFNTNSISVAVIMLLVGLASLFSAPQDTHARIFDPNNIISDQDLFDHTSLTRTAIQKFLEREGSVLATYTQVVNGIALKTSEIIKQVADQEKINPKFLLTTLEKEQGLISRSTASEKALTWATGYSCYNNTCKDKYEGMYKQLEAAAGTQRIYAQRAKDFIFQVGRATKTTDGYVVTPQNQATANLYIYTPYVGHAPELGIESQWGANKLFWRIWNRYFPSQKYLNGQVLTDGVDYWLIQKDQKRKFDSREILLQDYSLRDVTKVSANELSNYPDGPAIYYPNRSVVRSSQTNQIFYLEDNYKRPVIGSAALALLTDVRLALTESDIPSVPENTLTQYEVGTAITDRSLYPQGQLFENNGKLYLLKDNISYLVDPVVQQQQFTQQTPSPISDAELAKYPAGDPLKLKDGTFVMHDGKYYIISDGARMRITHDSIFDKVFGTDKKTSALAISQATLELHDAGEIIDYIDDSIQDPITTPSNNNQTPTYSGPLTYTGEIVGITPRGLIMLSGEKLKVTIISRNTGTATWKYGNVWLEATDKDSNTSTFNVSPKIELAQPTVPPGQFGLFTFDFTAPFEAEGLINQEFKLYYDKNGTKTELAKLGKFILIDPSGATGQVISNNLPTSIDGNARTKTYTISIKNTSKETTWLSSKTALEIKNHKGERSELYDRYDWVRDSIAAVPINKQRIAPGETAEFKFTFDPRGLEKTEYVLKISLTLLDKEKQVLLDGSKDITHVIRVK